MQRSTNLLNNILRYLLAVIAISLLALLVSFIVQCGSVETEVTSHDSKATQNSTSVNEEVGPVEGDEPKANDKEGAAEDDQVGTSKSKNFAVESLSVVADDKDKSNELRSGYAPHWLLISLLTLSTVANGCIALFIFRYNRERIKLLNDKKYVEPEALQETMRALSENTKALDKQLSELKHNNDRIVQSLGQQTSTALSKLEKDSQLHGEKVQDIMNAILEFNPKLDEKDKEIKRYKEGHDSKLVNKYILNYIKIRDQITKLTSSDQLVQKNLEQLIERLSMEIDHANVVEIEVLIGDKFLDDKYGGKLATPKLVPTDVTEKVGTIASVDLAGYEFTGNEKNMILRPAKVSVYELEQIK